MIELLSIGVLIFVSALFAMSEIAVSAARKVKLRVMADEGNSKALAVLKLQSEPGAFFAMIQIALNAIAILGGIIGEQALTPYIQGILELVYNGPLLGKISFLSSFFVVTSLFILFADLLPKRIAIIIPEIIAMRMVSIMRFVTRAIYPFVVFFNGLTNLILKLLKLPSEREEIVTTEDILAMMEAGAKHGSLQEQEYQLIENVFELEVRAIASAMTPRDQIIYIDVNDSTDEISEKIIAHPHNDFLVCDGSLDTILGSIESKAILRLVLKGELEQINLKQINKDIFYLPETLTLSEALNNFKIAPQPFSVIVNEYATVVGIATVKDLLSSFMGELITPQEEEPIVKRDANSWLIEGLTSMSEVIKYLELDNFPDSRQYETIAGFMIYQLKRLPKRTDAFIYKGYKFEVLDLEGVRVDQILVTKLVTH